ncbi:MAG: hypothetical protein WCC60_22390 [Ilumatobacteraceae bacterium]
MRSRCLLTRALLLTGLALAFGAAPTVVAQPTTTGPEVTLDRSEIEPGGRVVLTIDGFTALNVTISVCGNEARRGSSDCNMFASEGLKLDTDGTSTVIQIPVAAPPEPCPCVIRVADRLSDEIAFAPITLIGHPVEPVVDRPGPAQPLDVSISARPAAQGFVQGVRTSLGGPATYEVTVTVKNSSPAAFSKVALDGAVSRDGDQLSGLALDDPGEIAPGRTWQQVVTAEVPGPSFGDLHWTVDVSGAGPVVTAAETTTQRPTLLILLVLFLVADVFVLLIRFVVRRRARRQRAAGDAGAAAAGEATVVGEASEADRELATSSSR